MRLNFISNPYVQTVYESQQELLRKQYEIILTVTRAAYYSDTSSALCYSLKRRKISPGKW